MEVEDEEPGHQKRRRKLAVLPWMRHPVSIPTGTDVDIVKLRGINPGLAASLDSNGIDRLFAVQAATWRHTGGGASFNRDICLCAPTGSGKTLAYALPVLQGLWDRTNVSRLRALIVVPTGDLATQVAHVFSRLCDGSNLRVGVARARGSKDTFAVHTTSSGEIWSEPTTCTDRHVDLGPCGSPESSCSLKSFVDILVTPPGRLVAYLRENSNFSMADLDYLVVDEADRILRQSYQGWLPLVLASARQRLPRMMIGERGSSSQRLKKIVVSATLTHDPARLAGLHLHAPHLLTAVNEETMGDARYILPDRLEEYLVLADSDEKPLVLCALLKRLGNVPIIIFTSSVESTHRLYLLLEAMDGIPSRPVEYSSFAPQTVRAKALGTFRSGSNLLLVASDAATRGLDVDNVGAVISYDTPTHLKTYVHRVGRTARAGRRGAAYTLCRRTDEKSFRSMLGKIEGQACRPTLKSLDIEECETSAFVDALQCSLVAVKILLEAEISNAGVEDRLSSVISEASRVATASASQNWRATTNGIKHENISNP